MSFRDFYSTPILSRLSLTSYFSSSPVSFLPQSPKSHNFLLHHYNPIQFVTSLAFSSSQLRFHNPLSLYTKASTDFFLSRTVSILPGLTVIQIWDDGVQINVAKVLEYWAGRGMLQIFVAVMTRAFPDNSGKRIHLVLLQNIASYLLLACGVIYVVSGILCIGFLKHSRQQKEITREQAAKDLEELEKRREELETLLLSERE